ncbi:uncharacterized protein [Anser cygnoides]|uniref:uncharacterized protein isoform X2 n=1 Tax=Anser cygnoides TaxID=8845 RepID=UPI0034D2D6E3
MENSSLAGTHTDVAFVRLSTTQELAVSIRPAADGQGWMQPQRRECHGSELCQGQSWSPKHQPGRDECEKSRISPNPPGQCLPTPFLITCPRLVPLLAALLTRVTSSSVHSAKKMFLPGTLKAKKPHHLAVVRRREDGVLQPQADALIPPRVFLGDRLSDAPALQLREGIERGSSTMTLGRFPKTSGVQRRHHCKSAAGKSCCFATLPPTVLSNKEILRCSTSQD